MTQVIEGSRLPRQHQWIADRERRDHRAEANPLRVVRQIGAPALVINGALDPVIPPERGDELAQGLPAARQLVLPGVGHMVLEEAPDAVAEAILDFLPVTDL